MCALVMQEADAMDRLVECLAADTVHSTHCYMARRLREALEKRRQHPECECKHETQQFHRYILI